MKKASLRVIDNTTGINRDVDVTTYTCTWAKRPDVTKLLPFVDEVFVTDVGVEGSYWYSDGDQYRAVGSRVVLANQLTAGTAVTGGTSAVKTTGITIPAGLLKAGYNLITETTVEKTGTAGTTGVNLSLSPASAETNTSLGAAADTITSTNLFTSGTAKLSVLSTTTIKKLDVNGSLGQAATVPTAVTVPDVSAVATVFAAYVTNSAAGDSAKTHTFKVILETC